MVFQQTVETAYSLRELINRIHASIEYLNKYIKEHDNASNPLQRVVALTKIARERFRLQILVKKFGKAYLDASDRNIRETSVFVLNNPQYMLRLESVGQQIEKNFKWVMKEESRERDKSHMLRVYARSLIGKVKPAFKLVRRKIEALQRQRTAKQVAEANLRGIGKKVLSAPSKQEEENIRRMQQLKQQQTAGVRR